MGRGFLYPARWAGLRYVGLSGRGDGLLFDELTFSHPPHFIRWLPPVDVTEYVSMPTRAWAWHPAVQIKASRRGSPDGDCGYVGVLSGDLRRRAFIVCFDGGGI